MKPVIGILTSTGYAGDAMRSYLNMTYIDAVVRGGGIPLTLPITEDSEAFSRYLEFCDGFLYSGGPDIAPSFYNEEPHPLLGSSSLREDRFQLKAAELTLASGKPILGICRGIQLLNVALGGTLYQDVSEHPGQVLKHRQETARGDYSHTVSLTPGSRLHDMFGDRVMTNSYHHQSVKDPGAGLVVTGRAADGIIEAVELPDHPFCIGVQWHPEVMLTQEDSMLILFTAFVSACGSSRS